MCLNVFTVYMLLSHMLCVRLTCFLIKGHLRTYLLTYLPMRQTFTTISLIAVGAF